MKLNHLNLTVTSVVEAKAFLEKYFGLRSQPEGRSNQNFAILTDDNGLALTLMKAGHAMEVKYPGNFHIGFIQESESKVNEIYQRLKDDGFDVKPPEQHHAWTFYMNAPGGFAVEVLT